MHLRAPSIDHGVASFLWAISLGLSSGSSSLAVGVEKATAFIIALVSFGAIYLFVRMYGGDERP